MRALKAGTVLAVASIAIGALLLPGIGPAQNAPDFKQVFDKIEVMIPMRDGIRLQTVVFAPKEMRRAAAHFAYANALRSGNETHRGSRELSAASASCSRRATSSFSRTSAGASSPRGSSSCFGRRATRQSKINRRKHRRLRHHRLADQERAQQQRACGHARDILRRLADHHGPARSASRAEGRVRASLARPTCFWATTSIITALSG